MKNEGITLITLVITIIILIILSAVSINFVLGENGIIKTAKRAKENTQNAKIEEEIALNELYMQMEAEGVISGDAQYDAIAKLVEFKTAIANYIEEAGGIKPEYTAEATIFGDSIKGIVKEVTKDATATAEEITQGKTAWVNGELITGNGENNENIYIKYVDLRFPNIGGNGKTKDITIDLTDIPNYQNITVDNISTIKTIGHYTDTNGNIISITISIHSYSNGILTIRGTAFHSVYGEYAVNVPIIIKF